MSSPYGPPPGGGQQGPGQQGPGQQGPGQQGPGQYGSVGGPSWGAPQGGPTYGAPAGSPYGQPPAPVGQGAPGQWGGPPPKVKTPVDLGNILPLVLGALGVLGFVFGFLPGLKSVLGDGIGSSVSESVYFTQGYLPILILITGLLALAPRLPGGKAYLLPTALLAVAAFLGAIGALTSGTPEGATSGIGLILILILAFLQAAVAAYAWFVDSGVAKAPRPAKAPAAAGPAFGPGVSNGSSNAPAGQAAPQAPAGFGGYAPGAYSPSPTAAPAQASDAPSYGGYGSGSYAPPPADPVGAPYGSGAPTSGTPTQAGPSTGQHGRDDGPPADVTQQVRF